ncbi:hypothetical protein [uncultured Mediterranean phage uvMED]|nr:hypothetical protein [uncultured Mediterranean phage uvMED]
MGAGFKTGFKIKKSNWKGNKKPRFRIPFDPEKREIQKEGRNFQKAGFNSFLEYVRFLKKQAKKELELAVSKGKHPVTITEEDNL